MDLEAYVEVRLIGLLMHALSPSGDSHFDWMIYDAPSTYILSR